MNPGNSSHHRRRLKVLMTADTVGGVWNYALVLADALSSLGVDVILAAMGGRLSPDQRHATDAIQNLSVLESEYKLEWMEDPWADVRCAGEWLRDLERQHSPDLIHLNNFVHGALPFKVPILVVAHSCVYSWWRAVRNEAAPDVWRRYGQRVTDGLRNADMVVAPTRAMLDCIRENYGAFSRGRVIHNGCHVEDFKPGKKQNFILAAGRLWDEAKNVSTLCEAARGLEWPLHLAGEIQHPDGGKSSFSGVKLLGRLAHRDLAHRLSEASIYCLPARYEPFGLSVLEAALSGCCLVLGDIPSLREVWEDAALFVPPDDPAEIRSALQCLMSDAGMRRVMAQRARTQGLRYSDTRMAEEYHRLYGKLLHSRQQQVELVRKPQMEGSRTLGF